MKQTLIITALLLITLSAQADDAPNVFDLPFKQALSQEAIPTIKQNFANHPLLQQLKLIPEVTKAKLTGGYLSFAQVQVNTGTTVHSCLIKKELLTQSLLPKLKPYIRTFAYSASTANSEAFRANKKLRRVYAITHNELRVFYECLPDTDDDRWWLVLTTLDAEHETEKYVKN